MQHKCTNPVEKIESGRRRQVQV